jgi:TRAP transporter TAXI family solute receptor
MSRRAQKRLVALGTLILGLAAVGDAGRLASSAPSTWVRLRIVFESNFADALARQFAARVPHLRIEPIAAVGSAATVAAVERGDADIGFVLADVAYLDYERAVRERRPSGSPIRAIAALGPVAMHVLVRSGLIATNVHDLVGLRVGGGTALSSQPLLTNLLFHAFGLGSGVIQPDRRGDLLQGLDATIVVGYYPLATVTETIRDGAYLIPIDGRAADELRQQYPFVRRVTIPANTYSGQEQEIATLGVPRLLIANSALDEALVHELTRVFIETLPQLASSLHSSIRLTNLEWASATPIPLHDGAAQYYRERELMQ